MSVIQPVRIREIEVYHPEHVVDNAYYLDHFKKQGIDNEHFLVDILGRDKRYQIDNDTENTLTMAISVSKAVLHKAGLTGQDIDMICLATNSAEYVVPPCALIVHKAIGGKENAISYDLNANCVGMGTAMDQLVRYMSANDRVNRALLIGSEYLTLMAGPEESTAYGTFGDSACAVILEKTEDSKGVIDTQYMVNSSLVDAARGPRCGLSHSLGVKKEDIYYKFGLADLEIQTVADRIDKVLKEHNLTPKDIKMFCFSQFAAINIYKLRESLNITEEQSIYIGDEYGYTGSDSPFIALYEAIKRNKVKRGDYVFIWTVGVGTQHIFSLLQY